MRPCVVPAMAWSTIMDLQRDTVSVTRSTRRPALGVVRRQHLPHDLLEPRQVHEQGRARGRASVKAPTFEEKASPRRRGALTASGIVGERSSAPIAGRSRRLRSRRSRARRKSEGRRAPAGHFRESRMELANRTVDQRQHRDHRRPRTTIVAKAASALRPAHERAGRDLEDGARKMPMKTRTRASTIDTTAAARKTISTDQRRPDGDRGLEDASNRRGRPRPRRSRFSQHPARAPGDRPAGAEVSAAEERNERVWRSPPSPRRRPKR